MSESEPFTMEDAQDSGLVKREAGKQMASVAKRESPELYEHFEKVCEDKGLEPWKVLGGKAVKCLEDMEFAKQMSHMEIDMGQLHAEDIRVEDVEYVNKLAEQLGLNESQEDPIDKFLQRRLESVGGGKLGGFSKQEESSAGDEQLARVLDNLDSRLDKIESEVVEGEEQTGGGSDRQDLDSLFDGDEQQEEQQAPEPEPEPEESGPVLSSEEADGDE